jgi:hypothetical protein
MAYTLLEAVPQRFDTRPRTVRPRAEKTGVRPSDLFKMLDSHEANVEFARELSLGCFSDTNQKRLTRDSPIEIYRARLPGSVRLVVSRYLMDLDVDDPDASVSIMLILSTSLEKTYV